MGLGKGFGSPEVGMIRSVRRAGAVALGMIAGACAIVVGPDVDLVISTEHDRYQVEEGILLTLENKGNTKLVFPRCGDHVATVVEKRVQGNWVEYDRFGQVCLAIYSTVPLELGPAEQYQYVVSLIEPGEYRFRVHEVGSESGRGFASNVLLVME